MNPCASVLSGTRTLDEAPEQLAGFALYLPAFFEGGRGVPDRNASFVHPRRSSARHDAHDATRLLRYGCAVARTSDCRDTHDNSTTRAVRSVGSCRSVVAVPVAQAEGNGAAVGRSAVVGRCASHPGSTHDDKHGAPSAIIYEGGGR